MSLSADHEPDDDLAVHPLVSAALAGDDQALQALLRAALDDGDDSALAAARCAEPAHTREAARPGER